MKAAVGLQITLKCRLGVDDQDIEESLDRFADTIIAADADALIVHARKAWLEGLGPRENRDIPPVDHARVHRLKRRLHDFPIIINGGIHTIEEAEHHLQHVDGVMLGRAAYQNPGMLLAVDPSLFGAAAPVSDAREAVEKLFPYIEQAIMEGARLHDITRHLLGLFRRQPGARAFRRHLATKAVAAGAGAHVLREALAMVLDTNLELAQTAAA